MDDVLTQAMAHLKDEWAMITHAPLIFLLAVAASAILLYFVVRIHFSERLRVKDAHIEFLSKTVDEYKSRLDGAPPSQTTTRRAKLKIRINNAAPYVLSESTWLYRRFGVFNDGLAVADNVNVQLRAIHPPPTKCVGPLDLPLSVLTSGGSEPLVLRIPPGDEGLCTILDATAYRIGGAPSTGWQADNLGKGHTFTPSVFLEYGGQWEFDYVVQADNTDEVAFTLTVRATADNISVTRKT